MVRLNARPGPGAGAFDALAGLAATAGIRARAGVPGRLDAEGVSADGLARLLSGIAELATGAGAVEAIQAGLFDDVWVHVERM